MKPLHLALIRQRYTPFGGAERFVSRAMDALQAQGASVTLLTRKWEGGSDALICNPFYLGSLWRDWGFARCVCSRLAQHHFDLVQSHERISCCDIYRAGDGVHREWLAQRSRVLSPWQRLGVWLHPYHRYTLAAERRLFASPQLKAVICNSRMVQAEIVRHFGVAESKLRVIYSGVDLEMFHPRLRDQHRQIVRMQLGIPDNASLFLFVGSGFERKGLAAALRALPPAAYLVVVGHDRHAARYESLANQLGHADRVRFLGAQQDVKPYYGAADALVLPTLYDPFPNVALEALACGLPVITSTKCGAAELLAETGLVVDALDIHALHASMVVLLDPSQRLKHSEQARQLATDFGMQAMTDNLLRLYDELMQRAEL